MAAFLGFSLTTMMRFSLIVELELLLTIGRPYKYPSPEDVEIEQHI
jgi:hypothetical protein